MTLVRKTAGDRNFRQTHLSLQQQLFCPFYPLLNHVLVRTDTNRFFEGAGKVVGTELGDTRQFIYTELPF
jgi:hypothetical protein